MICKKSTSLRDCGPAGPPPAGIFSSVLLPAADTFIVKKNFCFWFHLNRPVCAPNVL